jgi:trans-aconitate methyltransferase
VDLRDAIELIGTAVAGRFGTWADLGAGSGTFTAALAQLLDPQSRIYAVDRDPHAIARLRRWSSMNQPNVTVVEADFTSLRDSTTFGGAPLDGILLANALHFVPNSASVLARLAQLARPGARVVIVEYDGRTPSRWVPYPIPRARLAELHTTAGLSPPTFTAVRPSSFGGTMYAAVGSVMNHAVPK